MRELRVVGVDAGGSRVICQDVESGEKFTIAADERLRAAARGDLSRLGQIEIEMTSSLRPREIQSRIRAGATVAEVAAIAGVSTDKIERFAHPVLLERSRAGRLWHNMNEPKAAVLEWAQRDHSDEEGEKSRSRTQRTEGGAGDAHQNGAATYDSTVAQESKRDIKHENKVEEKQARHVEDAKDKTGVSEGNKEEGSADVVDMRGPDAAPQKEENGALS